MISTDAIAKLAYYGRIPFLAKFFGLNDAEEAARLDTDLHLASIDRVRERFAPKLQATSASGQLRHLCLRSMASFQCMSLAKRRFRGLPVVLFRNVVFCCGIPMLLAEAVIRSVGTLLAGKGRTVLAVCMPTNQVVRETAAALFGQENLTVLSEKGMYFGSGEIGFFCRALLVCPSLAVHPWLLSNLLRWLAHYGHVVKVFAPGVIIIGAETTPSLSIITSYLRERGIKHVNIMHGERFIDSQGAFVEFDEFHVWGEYYRAMMVRQYCTEHQLRVTSPPLHRHYYTALRSRNQPRAKSALLFHYWLIYPGTPTYSSLLRVISVLDSSWTLYVRPHPKERAHLEGFLAAFLAEPIVKGTGLAVSIQLPEERSLVDALSDTRIVVGALSTAMLEGWIAGCKMIYLEGNGNPDTVLSMYGATHNALHLSKCTEGELKRFAATPCVIDCQENELVCHISNVERR